MKNLSRNQRMAMFAEWLRFKSRTSFSRYAESYYCEYDETGVCLQMYESNGILAWWGWMDVPEIYRDLIPELADVDVWQGVKPRYFERVWSLACDFGLSYRDYIYALYVAQDSEDRYARYLRGEDVSIPSCYGGDWDEFLYDKVRAALLGGSCEIRSNNNTVAVAKGKDVLKIFVA